jgi:hypothetical protein
MPPPNVVPFGKYKGQPVEVLAQDRPYLEWLSAQDWFRERYASIYTLIVNNFTEAAETPDHNALQVLFLDDAFCTRFLTVLKPQWRTAAIQHLTQLVLERKKHLIEGYGLGDRVKKQIDETISKFLNINWTSRFHREFEQRGIDVRLGCYIVTTELPERERYGADLFESAVDVCAGYFNIEIKPSVGDDYPAVLRQMRANNSHVLFTQNYAGVGATEEQFVKTFTLSDIKIVFRRDVDAIVLANGTGGGTLDIRTVEAAL